MTSSPELMHELRASRPTAPTALRTRVREVSARRTESRALWPRFAFPVRRVALIAVPAAAVLAFASAGVLGIARSDVSPEVYRDRSLDTLTVGTESVPPSVSPTWDTAQSGVRASGAGADAQVHGNVAPAPGRAIGLEDDRARRVSATLTVEVADSDAVSRAAQDALDLTRRLGGHVVSASVATGTEGSAALTVRVPVTKVQEAIVGLSGLGKIVSQQVTIDDLQEGLDQLGRRQRSLRSQIALVNARLESGTLDAETQARLEARLKTLRGELRGIRSSIAATRSEARMSTIQLTVVSSGAFGATAPPARLDRMIDEALNVLAWEGVIALAILIVLAPFALVAFAAWAGHRVYRRREEERLLAT